MVAAKYIFCNYSFWMKNVEDGISCGILGIYFQGHMLGSSRPRIVSPSKRAGAERGGVEETLK